MATRGGQVLLARLRQVNPTTALLTTGVLVLAGLFAPRPYGSVVLLLLVAALAALMSLTWAHTAARARVARLVILAVLLIVAVARLG